MLRLSKMAAASGRSGGGIGRLRRRRPAIPIVLGGRGMDQPKRRRAAAVPVMPDDALVEILSRVPARSICRFKCVSKSWHDLIADRLRCTKLPQTLAGFFIYNGDDEIHGGGGDDGGGKGDGGSGSSDDGGGKGDGGGGVSSDRIIDRSFIDTLGRNLPLASFTFLGKQPGIQEFGLLGSCNGLLPFGHRRLFDTYDSLGYIVCNPATEQWVAVPSSGRRPFSPSDFGMDSDSDTESDCIFTYLIFDPAVSAHFQLVEFWMDESVVEEAHTYSSETGVWCMNEWSSDGAVSFFA